MSDAPTPEGYTRPRSPALAALHDRYGIGTDPAATAVYLQAARIVEDEEAVYDALLRVVREDAIDAWLDAPNPAFGGERPGDLIDRGEADRVLKMVAEMEAGTSY